MIARRLLLGLAAAAPLLYWLPGAQAADLSLPPDLPPRGTWPITFTDLAGRRVTLAKPAERIIVGNYIQNFLLVGGRASIARIVGMTQDHWNTTRVGEYRVFTEAFPELRRIPSIGGYHDDILNSERILSLRPDVMLIGLTQYAANAARIELFERAGIRVIVIDYHAMKLANHVQSTRIIGRLLGRDDTAEVLANAAIQGLSEIEHRLSQIPESEKRRKIYLETGSKGVSLYGNSYNSSVLWGAILANLQAGNIAEKNREPWGALTREYVLAQNPEIVVIAGSLWNKSPADQMRMGFTVSEETARKSLEGFLHRPNWENLRAVKTRQFYAVDHGSLRSIIDWHMTAFLAKVLYPAAFADWNPQTALTADYRKYLPELNPEGTFVLALD